MFLPPYSPNYNPIELAFSAIKAFVRCAGELGRQDLDPNVDDAYVYVHLYEADEIIVSEKQIKRRGKCILSIESDTFESWIILPRIHDKVVCNAIIQTINKLQKHGGFKNSQITQLVNAS